MQSIVQYKVNNYRQWLKHLKKTEELQQKIYDVEQEIIQNLPDPPVFRGFSTTADKMVDFVVDRSSDGTINWRETLICPETHISNRLRRSYDVFLSEASPYKEDYIYINEQVTLFYTYLALRYPNLQGSEYLGDQCPFGEEINGIRNETMSSLTFEDESFDHVMSYECLEHIPDFVMALRETYRVLKKGGKFVFTVPFDHRAYENLIRATVSESGQIEHLMPPEYHGDPINDEGILCFTHFGWELLDILRDDIGFSEAYLVMGWSSSFANLGLAAFDLVAIK